jgi:spermidine/putrescine-binding protein
MKLTKVVLGAASVALLSAAALAEDMTIVSWGGAYSASQDNAYHQPYMAMHPDVNIINDESSPEAVAKLRAMTEAGNVTWDVVDVTTWSMWSPPTPYVCATKAWRWRSTSTSGSRRRPTAPRPPRISAI